MLGNFEAGKLAEHICIVHLLKMGVPCEIVNLDTIDIIAHHQKTLIRVQVKSSILKDKGAGRGRPGYQFHTCYSGKKTPLTSEQCDIIAFVGVNHERVLFHPVGFVNNQATRRISPAKFNKENVAENSWQRCLDSIFLTN